MPSGFPVTIKDSDGDPLEIAVEGGIVYIDGGANGASLFAFAATERETFAQAWIAACHEADRQASPELCGDRHGDWACAVAPGHAPLDHAAHDGQGQVCARWAVSDG